MYGTVQFKSMKPSHQLQLSPLDTKLLLLHRQTLSHQPWRCQRETFSGEPLMGPSRPHKKVRWADIESNPEDIIDSDEEGSVYDSFNMEDYRKLKDGVKNFMVPVLGRVSRNQLLNDDIPDLTAYLCFQVSFMFGHRPGVPETMTIEEFMNRQLVEEEAMYVIPVEKQKTASLKSAGIAISLEEEKLFLEYLKFARPALLKPSEPIPKNFLLSQKGRKLQNVSKIMNRFLGKIFPNDMRRGVSVPTKTTVRHLITTIIRRATNKTQEEGQMMDEYVCDSGLRQVRLQAILKAMSEKRGLGTDISKNLTEENFAKAVRRLGYKDTLPSLVNVWQKYQSYRIKKTYPIEPVVDETLLQCIINQSWIGLTLARSQEKDAGMGVYVSLPFWENQTCFGRFINHRANEDGPNLKWKQLVLENVKWPFLVATRDISAGKELYYDYGVRPGDFNEGQEMVFLMSGKARKRRRDAAVAMENKKPKEVVDASLGNFKPRTAREIQTQDDSSSESGVLAIHEREAREENRENVLIGSVVVIDRYIVSDAVKACQLPFIFNVVDSIEKKYATVFQYLDNAKILMYVSDLASKLYSNFKRYTSAFKRDRGIIYVVIFATESIGLKKLENEDVKASTINSAIADRAGSPMSTVNMDDNDVITQNREMMKFINIIKTVIYNPKTNNKAIKNDNAEYKIDEGFFYPVRKYDMSELSSRFKTLVNDVDKMRLDKAE
ncbi:hypothetical protein QYM36_019116 [Artemia franciscana]|uniref:SET domain-containing protein n=1 Tax=Artemia franciscana TaxID=6661 RepID=A0AA88KU11_ARTSF|nr:hypothetical protein QYM36_019116 [Artemia franciscana]